MVHEGTDMGRVLLAGFVVVFSCGVTLGQTPPAPAGGHDSNPAVGSGPVAIVPRDDCAAESCCSLDACECPVCGPAGRFWVGADYLRCRVRGDSLPPLLTASPAGAVRPDAGVLSAPGTVTLFGDSKVNDDWRSGRRVWAGFWLDEEQRGGSRPTSSCWRTRRPASTRPPTGTRSWPARFSTPS